MLQYSVMGNWGVFLGMTFGLQVASGIAVVMHYQASYDNTFGVLDIAIYLVLLLYVP